MPHLKQDRSIALRENEAGRDLIARREAILAQARIDAERWIDDGGSFHADAVPSMPARDDVHNVPAAGPRRRRLPGKNRPHATG
jgi:hypothetical protein